MSARHAAPVVQSGYICLKRAFKVMRHLSAGTTVTVSWRCPGVQGKRAATAAGATSNMTVSHGDSSLPTRGGLAAAAHAAINIATAALNDHGKQGISSTVRQGQSPERVCLPATQQRSQQRWLHTGQPEAQRLQSKQDSDSADSALMERMRVLHFSRTSPPWMGWLCSPLACPKASARGRATTAEVRPPKKSPREMGRRWVGAVVPFDEAAMAAEQCRCRLWCCLWLNLQAWRFERREGTPNREGALVSL